MPRWFPKRLWEGEEVFIIGGGPSLIGFDWNLLQSEKVIGCNNAYQLGNHICDVCVFGDLRWFELHKEKLAEFRGMVFTNVRQLLDGRNYKWLNTMPRRHRGLYLDALGWNDNTGAVAINLAIILGAKKIYLLGFDFYADNGRMNYHTDHPWEQKESVYKKLLGAFYPVFKDCRDKFPDVKIVNMNPDSRLNYFPKLEFPELFWIQRKQQWREQQKMQSEAS